MELTVAATLGNQNVPSQRWGRASIDRPQGGLCSATKMGVYLVQKQLVLRAQS